MQTLEIRSPSNVAIEYHLAPMTERTIAFLIDLLVVTVVVIALSIIYVRLDSIGLGGDEWMASFFLGFVPIVLMLLYFMLGEYYFEGQTIGKYALKIRTIRADGESPTLETFATRAALLFLDFMMTAGTLGFLAAISSPYRQRIGDRIAQTVVVRANPRTQYQLRDILSIKTVDEHVVVYPGAAKFTIGQALTIKELIERCDLSPNKRIDQLAIKTATLVAQRLELEQLPPRPVEFLRQVLRDYIVLTR